MQNRLFQEGPFIVWIVLCIMVLYFSGCASLTYNPYNKNETIKVILHE